MQEKNVSREFAEKYVYSSGLVIYTTEDPTIQATVEQEFSKTKYQLKGHEKDKNGSLKNDHTQDHSHCKPFYSPDIFCSCHIVTKQQQISKNKGRMVIHDHIMASQDHQ